MKNKVSVGKAIVATAAIAALIGFNASSIKGNPESSIAISPKPTQILEMKDVKVGTRKLDLPKEEKIDNEKEKIEVASVRIEVDEEKAAEEKKEDTQPAKKLTNDEIANKVINGEYGNGVERKAKLSKEGYDYKEIQRLVKLKTPKPTRAPSQVPEQSKNGAQKTPAPTNGKVIKAYPHNTFKSYMRWTALSTSSPQGKLCAKATADPSTAIMKYNGRYLVALGFAYSDRIGEEIDIVMESGQVIPAIVGDWKAKEHTDQWNSASTNNGSIVEFIVSSNEAANRAVNGSGSYNAIFPGKVKEFRKR